MNYGLCLFDLDGTLTDSKSGIVNSIKYGLNALGKAILDEGILDLFLGPPLRDSFKIFCGCDDIEAEKAIAKYREYYATQGIFENFPYPGIENLLKELRKNNIKLAVATSKPTYYAEKILARFKLDCYFELVAGSEMDGTRSDKAEIITYVLENLGTHKSVGVGVVMIGDRKHDIIGAKACRIDSIGARWGYATGDELEKAGCTYFASSPEELLNIILHKNNGV